MTFEKYIHRLLEKKVFPGITVFAGSHRRGVLLDKVYGNLAIEPDVQKLEPGAIYDIASLTKPLITALLVMMLVDRGELTADDPVNRFLNGFPDEMKIIHLLSHTSGLPDWYPLYLNEKGPVEVIGDLERVSAPGKKVVYSCLGYILLSGIIKRIAGMEFKEAAVSEIIRRAGLKDTYFDVPPAMIKRCAPTERGNSHERSMVERSYPGLGEGYPWRTHMLRGEVNDGNSFHLKGSSGNAGLFSTAADIFRLSREFYPGYTSLLRPETAMKFWENLTPFKRSHRSAGFKLNSSFVTSGGRSLSKKAAGHSGFTGTSLWMEPDPENVYILLTNRIHPVHDPGINFNRIRRKLHRLIKEGSGSV